MKQSYSLCCTFNTVIWKVFNNYFFIHNVFANLLMVREVEHLSYENRLEELGLLSLEKPAGRYHCGLSMYEGLYDRLEENLTKGCRKRIWGNSFKLKDGRFRWGIRKKIIFVCWEFWGILLVFVYLFSFSFTQWGWWTTRTDWPKGLVMPHPCMCLRLGLAEFWATCSSGKCPCPCQGLT